MRVARKLRKHRTQSLCFLDFDGTLVDIAPRPELVHLTSAARENPAAACASPARYARGRQRPPPPRTARAHRQSAVFTISVFMDGRATPNLRLPARARTALRGGPATSQTSLGRISGPFGSKTSAAACPFICWMCPQHCSRAFDANFAYGFCRFARRLHAVGNIRDVEILPRSIPGKGIAVRRFLAAARSSQVASLFISATISPTSLASLAAFGAAPGAGRSEPARTVARQIRPARSIGRIGQRC